MTLAAKIRDVLRRQLAKLRGRGVEISIERIGEVGRCASVTMLACHSGPQGIVSHLAVRDRVAGVTSETDFGFAEFDLASDRFFEVARFQILVSGGEIEAGNRGIVTHRALVLASVPFENPGLSARAKIPVNR